MSDPEALPQESTEPRPEGEPGINPEPEPEPEPQPEERELSAFEQVMVDEAQGEVHGANGEVEKQEDGPNGETSTREDACYADEAEALERDIPAEEKGVSEANTEPAQIEEAGGETAEKDNEEKPSEEPKKSGDPVADKNKLFIGGISLRCTKDFFHDFFSVYGPITDCFCIAKRGFGFVTFATEDAMKAVLAKHQAKELTMDGKHLDVKVAVPRDDYQNNPASKSKVKITLRPKRGRSADRPQLSVKRISTTSYKERHDERRDAREHDARDDRSRRDSHPYRGSREDPHHNSRDVHRESSRPSSSYRDSRDYRGSEPSSRNYKDPRDYRERDYYPREKESSRDYIPRGGEARHDERRSDYSRDSGSKDYGHKDYHEAPRERDALRDQPRDVSRDTRDYRGYSPAREYQSRDYASSSSSQARDKYYEKDYSASEAKDYPSHDSSSYRAPSPRGRESDSKSYSSRDVSRDYRRETSYREVAPADTRSYGGNRLPSPQRDVRDTRRDYDSSYRREDSYQKVKAPNANPYPAQQTSYASRSATSYGSSVPSYNNPASGGSSYSSSSNSSYSQASSYNSSSYSNPYTNPASTYGAPSPYPSYR